MCGTVLLLSHLDSRSIATISMVKAWWFVVWREYRFLIHGNPKTQQKNKFEMGC